MGAFRHAALTALCLLLLRPATCMAALDAGGSLALTSDDVYRGVSQTCGHPAAQADVHLRERGVSGWAAFAGVWGSAGLTASPCGSARELDAYTGYSLSPGADLTVTVMYTHYAFPGGDYYNPVLAGQRYDYDQLAMSWDLADRLFLTVAWTPDALGYESYHGWRRTTSNRGAFACGVQWQQPLASWVSLAAGAGYDRLADPFGTGYPYWSLGFTHPGGAWELNVAYFRTGQRATHLFGPEAAGGRLAATILWRF